MCGIVGAIAQRDVVNILLEGLRRLEYRGYDSSGVAVVSDSGELQRVRRAGKVADLVDAVKETPTPGFTGIAHTRWATHGEPNVANAHPHVSGSFAVVHNGIIENFEPLREQLLGLGYSFDSDTDTEVIVHMVNHQAKTAKTLLEAVQNTVALLEGAYGMVVMNSESPDELIVARSGSPLVIGLGVGENFIASDQLALFPVTHRFMFLEEGDVAHITGEKVSVYNEQGEPIERAVKESDAEHDAGDKGSYRHYMLKEIYEQPDAINNTLEGRLNHDHINLDVMSKEALALLNKTRAVQIVACGTSYNSGLVAKYWFEEIAGIQCRVEIASEFRYRKFVVPENCLFVTLSQSGETADTMAALTLAKERGYMGSLAICNVPGSSLVRESDAALMTRAGVEIGVASTKAFTTQLVNLLMLVVAIGRNNGLSQTEEAKIVESLRQLPRMVGEALELSNDIQALAKRFTHKHHSLFLGRGNQYPIAMEGALKLKEISYIHAEAYAAGELKHGPLALVDDEMPVIVVAPKNELLDKLKSNIEEVRARGGELFVFADVTAGLKADDNLHIIPMNHVPDNIAPIVYTIPLQLLSYHVAIIKGTDVDQPRNLAKSVTVE